GIDLVLAVFNCRADRIKRSRRVGPVQMPNQAHLTEKQFLTAGPQRECRLIRTAQFQISLTKIESVFIRRSIGLDVAEHGLRILGLYLESHPRCRADLHIEPEPAQVIGIAAIGGGTELEANPLDSFHTLA